MADDTSAWRFDGLRAMYINCTLKKSPGQSHTGGLVDASAAVMRKHGVEVEIIRAVDHDIATGVYVDMTEHGWASDEWPEFEPGNATVLLNVVPNSVEPIDLQSGRRSCPG